MLSLTIRNNVNFGAITKAIFKDGGDTPRYDDIRNMSEETERVLSNVTNYGDKIRRTFANKETGIADYEIPEKPENENITSKCANPTVEFILGKPIKSLTPTLRMPVHYIVTGSEVKSYRKIVNDFKNGGIDKKTANIQIKELMKNKTMPKNKVVVIDAANPYRIKINNITVRNMTNIEKCSDKINLCRLDFIN